MVELILAKAGYAVIKANREVPVREIAGIKPDLAILDFLLPFGLGTEICRHMKSDVSTKDIPVILYSASSNLSELARNCGANAFLEKPFDVGELEKIVADMLA